MTTSRRCITQSSSAPRAPTRRMRWHGLLMPLTAALVMVTGCNDSASADRTTNWADVPLDQRIGWLDENCFAIDNASLAKGTSVVIVALDEQPTIIRAQIQLTARQAARCATAHAQKSRGPNDKAPTFYELRLPQNAHITLGVGVVGDTKPVAAGLDVNGDGIAESFTSCTTNDGVNFGVWAREPYRGDALWTGHYSLGVPTEPNCPDALTR